MPFHFISDCTSFHLYHCWCHLLHHLWNLRNRLLRGSVVTKWSDVNSVASWLIRNSTTIWSLSNFCKMKLRWLPFLQPFLLSFLRSNTTNKGTRNLPIANLCPIEFPWNPSAAPYYSSTLSGRKRTCSTVNSRFSTFGTAAQGITFRSRHEHGDSVDLDSSLNEPTASSPLYDSMWPDDVCTIADTTTPHSTFNRFRFSSLNSQS